MTAKKTADVRFCRFCYGNFCKSGLDDFEEHFAQVDYIRKGAMQTSCYEQDKNMNSKESKTVFIARTIKNVIYRSCLKIKSKRPKL